MVKKILKQIIKFSGLEKLFANRKLRIRCQPQYCAYGYKMGDNNNDSLRMDFLERG